MSNVNIDSLTLHVFLFTKFFFLIQFIFNFVAQHKIQSSPYMKKSVCLSITKDLASLINNGLLYLRNFQKKKFQ